MKRKKKTVLYNHKNWFSKKKRDFARQITCLSRENLTNFKKFNLLAMLCSVNLMNIFSISRKGT